LSLSSWVRMKTSRLRVPERTCIACRKTGPKLNFVRLVRLSKGNIVVDEEAKKAGRGAYLCRNRECWEKVLTTGRKEQLARALRTNVSQENRTALVQYGMTFPYAEAVAERGLE